jgi:hypothetical protein
MWQMYTADATSASGPAYPRLRGGKCGDGVRGGFAAPGRCNSPGQMYLLLLNEIIL